MRQFLLTDASLTFLVVCLSVLLFVVYPLVEPGSAASRVADVLTSLVLASAAYAASDRRGTKVFCAVLAGVTLVLHWSYSVAPGHLTLTLRAASLMVFLSVVTGLVFYQVIRPGRVTGHRVLGAVAVYLMLGLIWASAYSLVAIGDPEAFDFGVEMSSGGLEELVEELQGRMVYFSFVTQTTLGYGDVTPLSRMAGNLAILQALVGQLYLGVILARIVSLVVTEPRGDR
jgi:hypothetical protein